MIEIKQVTIPGSVEHGGMNKVKVLVAWQCPVCGGPRGEVEEVHSYDGSRRMNVDGWANPCGHVDTYVAVRKEAAANGLNKEVFAARWPVTAY